MICPHCIDNYGEVGAEAMAVLPETKEEVAEHLENYHHGHVVARPGETREEAKLRCEKKGMFPEDPQKCMCEECKDGRWLRESTLCKE